MPSDRVKQLEDRIDRVAAKLAGDMKRVARKVYDRKLYSEPVPMKERVEEWRIMEELADAGGVDAAVEMFKRQGMSPETVKKEILALEKEAANGKTDQSPGGVGPTYP